MMLSKTTNKKDADQSVRVRKLVCPFVVCKPPTHRVPILLKTKISGGGHKFSEFAEDEYSDKIFFEINFYYCLYFYTLWYKSSL